ncbi:hypothetical protein U1Q18_029270, partial [Sarracenia purpurea var. burkii]
CDVEENFSPNCTSSMLCHRLDWTPPSLLSLLHKVSNESVTPALASFETLQVGPFSFFFPFFSGRGMQGYDNNP